MKKYRIITLCGSTRFKDEFLQMQKELTLKGYIVLSVGLFGHSGDEEVWDGKEIKTMLDDMHKAKIDMSDEIFVINPEHYIGESTWSEICYARMLKKRIRFLVPIDERKIDDLVQKHITTAEKLAWQQIDGIRHSDGYYNVSDYVYFKHKGKEIVDPWINVETHYNGTPWISHDDVKQRVDPFKYYGKKKMAWFIEKIIETRKRL